MDELRKRYQHAYMIDTAKCLSKVGKMKPNGLFKIFGQFSKKNASETHKAMLRWANDQTLDLVKYTSTAFFKLGDSLAGLAT